MKKRIKEKLKKVISILLITVYLLFPFRVFACPHLDENGRIIFQLYNDDFTIVTFLYPEENHIYNRNLLFEDYSTLISESFGFPMVKSKESHIGLYVFVDERLQNFDWSNIDSIDVTPTVEGLNSWSVSGENFSLNVGLKNTFQASRKHVNETIIEMHYNVSVKRQNDNRTNRNYIDSKTKIENRELELIVPEILKMEADFSYVEEKVWQVKNIDIDELYDSIEVRIYSDIKVEDVVAVNISGTFNSNDLIPVVFDSRNKMYRFEVSEPGTYIPINSNFDKELFDSEFENEKEEEKIEENEEEPKVNEGLNILYIIVPTIGVLVLIGLIIIERKNQKKR